jgi:hypothetical protein
MMPIEVKPSRSLPPQQRRRLIGLTLILAGALLALLVLSVSAAADIPLIPSRATPLVGSTDKGPDDPSGPNAATPQPTATPVRLWDWLWRENSTTLAEEPGPTSTPKFYVAFLPDVSFQPTVPAAAELLPEPPPVPPTPNWPDGLDRLTTRKLGVHVVQNNDT